MTFDAARPWRSAGALLAQVDLDALLRHANNAKIAANLRDQFPHPYTRRDAIEYLGFVRDQTPERAFAIQHRDEAIGGLGFQVGLDISRVSAEIGYWIGETQWGRGFATRAVSAVTEWAFTEYKLTRVSRWFLLTTQPLSACSKKPAFQREGVLRRSAIKNGVVLDQLIYAHL